MDKVLFDTLAGKVRRAAIMRESLVERKEKLESEIAQLEGYMAKLEQAAEAVRDTSETVQRVAMASVEAVVNAALQDVFMGEYVFKIDFRVLRGKVAADLKLVRGDVEYSLVDTVGGGVIDVVALALRLAFWAIRKDSAPVLVFDEPMRFLSKGNALAASELLKRLSEDLGIQIIMVTHTPEFAEYADRVFEVTRDLGKESKVGVVK